MKAEENEQLRKAILTSIPVQTSQFGEPIPPRIVYLPRTHLQALSPDNMLVVGIRGAGKSFWWQALQTPAVRALFALLVPKVGIGTNTRVSAGFGASPTPAYPDRDTLTSLVKQQLAPRLIWKTVVVWQVCEELPVLQRWSERVEWVVGHPEEVAGLLRDANARLVAANTKHLVLFDALDLAAASWRDLQTLLRGLLELLLELRSMPGVRAKAFVRPDMLEMADVTAFPDASKVVGSKVELRWPRVELYGLLWHSLGNAEEGAPVFQALARRVAGESGQKHDGIWLPPEVLLREETSQRALFDEIAGEWMGRDHRRGFPYTWLPNHLADAHEQTSPRSFLAAVRSAAADERYRAHTHALHWEAIKRGVQEASAIRVREMNEDHPWVKTVMEPLANLVIPCERTAITKRWASAQVQAQLASDPVRRPRRLESGARGIVDDLRELGVFAVMHDDRVNVPDVFRLGYGLLRKGGVKPVR